MRRTEKGSSFGKTLAASFMSLLLAMASVPAVAFAQPAQQQAIARPTPEQIQDMLTGRDYVEGDAIVVAEVGTALNVYSSDDDLDHEELSLVNDTAMDLTAGAAKESEEATNLISAERAEQSAAASYEISVVHSNTLSTAELIAELYNSPQVISASPNYITNASAASGNASEDEALVTASTLTNEIATRGEFKPFGVHDAEVGDLSSLQWSLGRAENSGTFNTLEGPNADVGMDVPGYDGHGGGELNSDTYATIGVLDSGMDVTHPDLEGVFYTFTPEQQERWGCGEHGYNSTVPLGDVAAGDLTDTVSHGTHVSGIMSAKWDGKGTAGVANGAKLIGVRLSADDGEQTSEGTIRAFQFVTQIAKEVNLKAINCSWGTDQGTVEFVFSLLVNELGEQGVLTVFAAGNASGDNDQVIETPSFIESPYLLSVGCMSPSGAASYFSSYGETNVDVFAPGAAILSTVPAKINTGYTHEYYNSYYPQSGQGVLSCVKFADGADDGVTVYNENPLEDPSAVVTAEVTSEVGVDDMLSLKIRHDEFHPADEYSESAQAPLEYVYMKIPAGTTDPSQISYVSAQFTTDFGRMHINGILYGFMGVTADGTPKIVNFDNESGNYYSAACVRVGKAAWGNACMNIDHMLEADGEANEVYLDEDGNMIVIVRIQELTNLDSYTPVEYLYVDDITVGNSEGHPSNHKAFNGTSMAAPAVTAACAVVSRGETPSYELDSADLGMQAIERSARLRAATVETEALSNLCATGGHVRLTGYENLDADSMAKAPTITSAVVKNGVVEVKGYFFKSAGVVSIDGFETTPTSWSDNAVTFALPQDVENASHVLAIRTDEGLDKFPLQVSEESKRGEIQLYEHELSTPDVYDTSWTDGPGSTVGGLTASGNYLYTFQRDMNKSVCGFWRYDIAKDTWESCPLPYKNPKVDGSNLAATEDGVVLFTEIVDGKDEYGTDTYKPALYDYNVASNSWTQRDIECELPFAYGIFTRGKDLFFVGGSITDPDNVGEEGEPLYIDCLLSVLRDGAAHVEVLAELQKDYEYNLYLGSNTVAAYGNHVYIAGSEPITDGNSHTPSPKALFRLTLDDDDHVVSMDAIVGELVDLGIAAKGDGGLTPAVAAAPGTGIVVSSDGYIASDTFLWESGSDALTHYDRSSSYYRSNTQEAVYHNGKLYVLGYSPSESGKFFFRATDFVGESGELKVGWQKDAATKKWHYVDETTGKMVHGWLKDDGKWYYLGLKDGAMYQNQWLRDPDDGNWYYLGGTGAMYQKQWLKDGGKWYYLNRTGAMVRNMGARIRDSWGDHWYWFFNDGHMAQDETVNIGYGDYVYNHMGYWTAYEAAKK